MMDVRNGRSLIFASNCCCVLFARNRTSKMAKSAIWLPAYQVVVVLRHGRRSILMQVCFRIVDRSFRCSCEITSRSARLVSNLAVPRKPLPLLGPWMSVKIIESCVGLVWGLFRVRPALTVPEQSSCDGALMRITPAFTGNGQGQVCPAPNFITAVTVLNLFVFFHVVAQNQPGGGPPPEPASFDPAPFAFFAWVPVFEANAFLATGIHRGRQNPTSKSRQVPRFHDIGRIITG